MGTVKFVDGSEIELRGSGGGKLAGSAEGVIIDFGGPPSVEGVGEALREIEAASFAEDLEQLGEVGKAAAAASRPMRDGEQIEGRLPPTVEGHTLPSIAAIIGTEER